MIVCQECKKPIYKKFEWRCLSCKPMPGETNFKKVILTHACQTSANKIKEVIVPIPEHHPVATCWEKADLSLEAAERNHILRIVDNCKGNKSKAALVLKITVKTLYNKLTAYGLHTHSKGLVQ